MGKTRMLPGAAPLVSHRQAEDLGPRLLPGDILLTRRDWRISGIGLPGYWTHAALYIGTPERRRGFFGAEGAWADVGYEAWLQEQCPEAYALSADRAARGVRTEVVEALADGVLLNDMATAGHADSVAVLRPRLPRAEIGRAIARALRLTGRPYDYGFDFGSDYALVCSEVVCRAYAPGPGMTGLDFPTASRYGRRLTVANDMARLVSEEQGLPDAQLDLVAFLDGDRPTGRVVERSVEEFHASWRRPKWHAIAESF